MSRRKILNYVEIGDVPVGRPEVHRFRTSVPVAAVSRWSDLAVVLRASDLGPQPIMPLDLPVKVRSWEIDGLPTSSYSTLVRGDPAGASSNVNVLERRAGQLAGRNMSVK